MFLCFIQKFAPFVSVVSSNDEFIVSILSSVGERRNGSWVINTNKSDLLRHHLKLLLQLLAHFGEKSILLVVLIKSLQSLISQSFSFLSSLHFFSDFVWCIIVCCFKSTIFNLMLHFCVKRTNSDFIQIALDSITDLLTLSFHHLIDDHSILSLHLWFLNHWSESCLLLSLTFIQFFCLWRFRGNLWFLWNSELIIINNETSALLSLLVQNYWIVFVRLVRLGRAISWIRKDSWCGTLFFDLSFLLKVRTLNDLEI